MSKTTIRRRAALGALAGMATFLTGASVASADVVDMAPLDGNRGFTTFVRGDASVTRNETEGSMALGGNLTIPAGSTYNVTGQSGYYPDTPPASRGTNLFVGGRVVFGGGQVTVNQGYVRVVDGTGAEGVTSGGTAEIRPAAGAGGGRILINSGQPAATMFGVPDDPIDFTGAFAAFADRSEDLAACTATVALENANGNPIDIDSGSNLSVYPRLVAGTNVLNLTVAQLARISEIVIRDAHPLLINVTGHTTGDLALPRFAGADMKGRLIINLPGATEVNLVGSPQVPATIYAPTATVNNRLSNNIDGAVIADAFSHTGGGEIHPFPFTPTISCDSPDDSGGGDTDPGNPGGGTIDPDNPGGGGTTTQPAGPGTPAIPGTPGGSVLGTPDAAQPSATGGTTATRGATARLAITKRAPIRARGLQRITYTVVVRNTGRAAARGVVVTDRLPSRLTFVRATRGATLRGGTVRVSLGTLRPGQVRRIRIVMRAPADTRGRIINTARVSATGVRAASARAVTVVTPTVRRVRPAVTG